MLRKQSTEHGHYQVNVRLIRCLYKIITAPVITNIIHKSVGLKSNVNYENTYYPINCQCIIRWYNHQRDLSHCRNSLQDTEVFCKIRKDFIFSLLNVFRRLTV